MTIAIAQMRVALADPRKNKQQMLELIQRARIAGAETIIFPEFALCGYLADELVNDEGLIADCAAEAQAIAAAADDIQVIFGNLHRENGVTESRIFLAADSQLAAVPALGAANYFASTILDVYKRQAQDRADHTTDKGDDTDD